MIYFIFSLSFAFSFSFKIFSRVGGALGEQEARPLTVCYKIFLIGGTAIEAVYDNGYYYGKAVYGAEAESTNKYDCNMIDNKIFEKCFEIFLNKYKKGYLLGVSTPDPTAHPTPHPQIIDNLTVLFNGYEYEYEFEFKEEGNLIDPGDIISPLSITITIAVTILIGIYAPTPIGIEFDFLGVSTPLVAPAINNDITGAEAPNTVNFNFDPSVVLSPPITTTAVESTVILSVASICTIKLNGYGLVCAVVAAPGYLFLSVEYTTLDPAPRAEINNYSELVNIQLSKKASRPRRYAPGVTPKVIEKDFDSELVK